MIIELSLLAIAFIAGVLILFMKGIALTRSKYDQQLCDKEQVECLKSK